MLRSESKIADKSSASIDKKRTIFIDNNSSTCSYGLRVRTVEQQLLPPALSSHAEARPQAVLNFCHSYRRGPLLQLREILSENITSGGAVTNVSFERYEAI